ncbi:MAG: MarR family transcriptional regulator [Thaumarchaeota archaeon]|nr:MarR family transcriptional regulator [Nitrososphaerota archaeon]
MSFADNYAGDASVVRGIDELEQPSDNDLLVLKAIGEDEEAQELSFQGIKRKLGVHQETLSRALHRLQRDGFVERLEHAYRISPKGLTTISQGKQPFRPKIDSVIDPYLVSLLQAKLPTDVNVNEIVNALSYRWFGNLRWLGSTQTPDSATLSWITNDSGLKISVRIKEDALNIETIPTSAYSVSEASRAAFQLFDLITKVMKGPARSGDPSNLSGNAAA